MREHLPTPDNALATALEVLGTALQLDCQRSPATFAMVVDEVQIDIHEALLDEYTHDEAAMIFSVWHDKFVVKPAEAA
jgi:hypothetical protein